MSDGTPKAAKPSGAGRRKGRTATGRNAVARARGAAAAGCGGSLRPRSSLSRWPWLSR
jgi:hypothetical protein